MVCAASESIHDAAVLPALRDLLSRYPLAVSCGPEMLAKRLFVLCYLDVLPPAPEVEVALEALVLEGEIVA